METNTFEICPKCGGEVEKIQCGTILVEHCPNCNGIFLDYDELKKPEVARMIIDYSKQRADAKELDNIDIVCPKCKVAMRKKASEKKVILDVCPICRGIWFDHDELAKYRKKAFDLLVCPQKMRICKICRNCNIKIDYDKDKCPRCGEILGYEPISEIYIPRIRIKRKGLWTFIMLVTILPTIFILSYFAVESLLEALLFTFTIGLGVAFILIRVIVFNRFPGPPRGPYYAKEYFFNLPLCEEDECE